MLCPGVVFHIEGSGLGSGLSSGLTILLKEERFIMYYYRSSCHLGCHFMWRINMSKLGKEEGEFIRKCLKAGSPLITLPLSHFGSKEQGSPLSRELGTAAEQDFNFTKRVDR